MDGTVQPDATKSSDPRVLGRRKTGGRFLALLVGLTAIYTIGLSVIALYRTELPGNSRLVYVFAFAVFVTGWVSADRRARGIPVPFEFNILVYATWPIFVPYYLVRTRGWKGILLGIGFWGLFLAPMIVAAAVFATVVK